MGQAELLNCLHSFNLRIKESQEHNENVETNFKF